MMKVGFAGPGVDPEPVFPPSPCRAAMEKEAPQARQETVVHEEIP